MNVLSSVKALMCLLKCGHFLYSAKRLVSAATVILLLCLGLSCLFGNRRAVKRLSKKLGAVMK